MVTVVVVSILSGLLWYFLHGWYTCIGPDCHEGVITLHHFPHYWPFARGIHRPLVDSPNKGSVMWGFHVFFDVSLNKLLNKQSEDRWSEVPWRSCDDRGAFRIWGKPLDLNELKSPYHEHSIVSKPLAHKIWNLIFFQRRHKCFSALGPVKNCRMWAKSLGTQAKKYEKTCTACIFFGM